MFMSKNRPHCEPPMLKRPQSHICQKHSGLGEQEKPQCFCPLLWGPLPARPHLNGLQLQALVSLLLAPADLPRGHASKNGDGGLWISALSSGFFLTMAPLHPVYSRQVPIWSCLLKDLDARVLIPGSEMWALGAAPSWFPSRHAQTSKTSY